MGRLLRLAVIGAGAIGLVLIVGPLLGRSGSLLVSLSLFALAMLVWVVGPRVAHRAFGAGAFVRATALYQLLAWVRFDREVRRSLEVSLAACLLGRERWADAAAALARVDPADLGEALRAIWLNDRAYAGLRGGGDAGAALADADRALALRPQGPGFRHTRGLALLELGRLEEAVRQLDAVWEPPGADRAAPLLESERCYDLGIAWTLLGEGEYAIDHFHRSRRAAPGSVWAARAAARIPRNDHLPEVVADLV